MRKLCLLILHLVIAGLLIAQPGTRNTLLWRVYKPGAARPSFVFGTMHVTDTRAFNFTDSLYYYLGQSDAFAMEVHPDSFSLITDDDYISEISSSRKDQAANGYRQLEESLDKKTVARLREKFKEEIGDRKMTDRELAEFVLDKFVEGRKKKKKKGESMNTFMDAFLYNLAEQQGKKILGLESPSGLTGLVGRLGNEIRYENIPKLINAWDFTEESPIHSLYYREQFDSLDIVYSLLFNEPMLDDFLYKRNQTMAEGMDSVIAGGKALFTAVGAAHLPGEKGLINLLRKKGYRAEPVFSAIRIPASEYTKGMTRNRTWTPYENTQFGISYELPGNVKEQESAKGERVMYYNDIGGGFIYTIRFGRLSNAELKKKADFLFNARLLRYCVETAGLPGTKNDITYAGLKGKETIISQGKEYFTRYREILDSNIFYRLTVTAGQKEMLTKDEPERFFASLKILPVPAVAWSPFAPGEEGFRISLPGQPTEEPDEEDADATVHTKTWGFFDRKTGINYAVIFSQTINGNQYISSGKDFLFNDYLGEMKKLSGNKEVSSRDTVIDGYAGKVFKTAYYDNNQIEGLLLRRKNTSYYVFAEYDTSAVAGKDIRKYLSSFSLQPFKKASWKQQVAEAGDFSIWSPVKADSVKPEEEPRSAAVQKTDYVLQDPYSSVIYMVTRFRLSPYFWAANEDSVYSFIKQEESLSWMDSLLYFKTIQLGNSTAREMLVMDRRDSSRTCLRFVLNGTSYYRIETPLLPALDNDPEQERFLSSFTLLKPESGDEIYKRTPEQLFNDLASGDSIIHRGAFAAFDQVMFTPREFSLLLEKLRRPYPEFPDEYYSIYTKITDRLDAMLKQSAAPGLADSVLQFTALHYAGTDSVAEKNRFNLLSLLTTVKTAAAYNQIGTLLAKRLPVNGNEYRFYSRLQDSLSLTASLFPALLNYAADSVNGLPVIEIAERLLDSGYLQKSAFQKAVPALLKQARTQLKAVLKEPADSYEWDYRVNNLLSLLGKLNTPETPALLNEYLRVKIMDIKKQAAVSLLRLGKKVPAAVLEDLAEDRYYRTELYEELVKINKSQLFPVRYRDQVSMAEGYLVKSLRDEDEYNIDELQISYIKKKEIKTGSGKGVYYLFRVNFDYDAETGEAGESYLGVAGPFATDPSVLLVENDKLISGIYFDEEFDGMNTDQHAQKYIGEWLSWREDEEKEKEEEEE